MSRRTSTRVPRDSEERFKTHDAVSRALTVLAEQRRISKQELLHEIASEWVADRVHAARLVLSAVGDEGLPGIGGD